MGIGDATRWRILAALAEGEPLMVLELAQRLGKDTSTVSKHLAVLRTAGMVEVGRGRLYQIPARCLVDRSQRLVDYGRALFRFNEPE